MPVSCALGRSGRLGLRVPAAAMRASCLLNRCSSGMVFPISVLHRISTPRAVICSISCWIRSRGSRNSGMP